MNKRKSILLTVVLLVFCLLPGIPSSAAGMSVIRADAQAKAGSQTSGWHTTAKGKKYYVGKDGKKAVGWTKIKGRYYYFNRNGILNSKTGWVKIGKDTYYIRKDGSRSDPGFCKIKKKTYYFDKNGKLVVSKRAYLVGKQYYNIDSKGVTEKISKLEAQCELEAQKFIEKHTKTSMSAKEKLRACFRYLLAYMRYRPQAPDWSEFKVKEWYYQKAVNTFRSPTLSGNCYSFACSVAACAKELGYKPTVIVITADHGFVMIDGKYYDNMKGGLFDSSVPSSPGYKVYTKAEF